MISIPTRWSPALLAAALVIPSSTFAVPSLTSIRDSLSVLEDSIVHSLLSLSSTSKSKSTLPSLDHLDSIFSITFNQTFVSQVPLKNSFISSTHPQFPPYLLTNRADGSQFGDNATHNRTQSIGNIYQFFNKELFSSSTSTSILPNDSNLLLLQSASFLSLLSSRIHLGISVAQSKFSTNQTQLCHLIIKDDREGIRTFITVPTQETLVKDRVESKASAWSTVPLITQDPSKPQLNETAQPSFDYTKARKLFER